MNQNTTIETIREAIGKITSLVNSAPHPDIVYTGELREIRTGLCALANRLEAAQPKEQPPVEQSEPAAEHPLQEFCDELEELLWKEVNAVRLTPYRTADDICTAVRNLSNKYNPRYAPPAVIEPEPELDEFELELREWQANDDKDVAILERVIGLYREMITRKGDK